ncbi:MAG: ATP-dependent RNA helicase DeaD, partial [Halothiobacillaceae bacterium]
RGAKEVSRGMERPTRESSNRTERPARERETAVPPQRSERFNVAPRREVSDEKPRRHAVRSEAGMVTYRIDVGREHGVLPKNIVGAVANEAGIDSSDIGHIKLYDDYSTIDLPADLSKELTQQLKNVWVCNRKLNLTLFGEERASGPSFPKKRLGLPDKTRAPVKEEKKKFRLRDKKNIGKPKRKPAEPLA